MEIQNACYDISDERDYKYRDVFENDFLGVENYISSCILDNVEYQNQGLQDETKMGCVFFSSGHGSNEENFQEGSEVKIDNIELCRIAKNEGLLTEDGAKVKSGPDLLKTLGYTKGYALINTIEEAKHSIINKRPIVVGSNKIKWSSAINSPYILSGNSGSGHSVLIIGYDDNYEGGCFIIKNSYGKNKYDNGKMYLKYENFDLLFNGKYSLIDKEDEILTFKQKIMDNINIEKAKEAFELGIWNGENPTNPATREEVATMILRGIEKFKNGEI